jgi:hypothetical protein
MFLFFLPVYFAPYSYGIEIDTIGILTDKSIVLSFPASIINVKISHSIANITIGEEDYVCEKEGSDVFLRAKKDSAKPATLYVRYGSLEKTITYVAKIVPAEEAPLHLKIGRLNSIQEFEKKVQENVVNGQENVATGQENQARLFSPNEKQQYTFFAIKEEGITLMVTNIHHNGKNTYLRVFVDNNTTVNLKISQCSFSYVTKLRKWWFFTTEQRNPVSPLISPDNVEVGPLQFNYFDFSIPTVVSNGGLEVSLAESENGARNFTIPIPSKVILKAPRK